MSEVLKALLDPKLLPWLLAASVLLFVGQFISKRAEDWLSQSLALPPYKQVEAFVLLIHIALGVVSTAYCYLLTDLPPPAIGADVRSIFGSAVLRLTGYMFPLVGVVLSAACLFGRTIDDENRAPGPIQILRHGAHLFFIGVFASWIIVGFSALASPELVIRQTMPITSPDIALWWYSLASLVSMSAGLAIYLPLVALQQLWKIAGRIP